MPDPPQVAQAPNLIICGRYRMHDVPAGRAQPVLGVTSASQQTLSSRANKERQFAEIMTRVPACSHIIG
jgi:hypothetical protein